MILCQNLLFSGFTLVMCRTLPVTEAESIRDLSRSVTNFGRRLFQSMDISDKNVFISPLSIREALLLAANGAEGETFKSFESALNVPGRRRSRHIHSYFETTSAIENRTQRRPLFTMVNSLWISPTAQPYEKYLSECRSLFRAEAQQLDFSSHSSVTKINEHISKNTNGLIPNAVGSLDPETKMLLVNTIHFKHQFSVQFNERDTFYEDFTWFNGQKRKVKMMHMTNDMEYLHAQNVSLVNLGYTHPDARMLLILPHQHGQKALEEAIEHCFDPATFESLVQKGHLSNVKLSVPRFEMEYTESLKGPLSRLGMGRAFSNDAEFPHISPEPLTLDDVVHQSVLKVHEEGTEAAAVTVVGVKRKTMAPPPFPPIEFKLDRPFIVVLYDQRDGIILFQGVVSQLGTS
ncbi:putative Heparin cofactor 2 [Blattamonas nauphoetae]|uniref:Heparin cofactor 2 n=1 Tax=Blattamonas nauphoetae TaxID=2049346 RepID=A0ABQ9X2X7_9EUKA|nr:putative Heparin cofactor 2 [Blattamonas nauphoetae]